MYVFVLFRNPHTNVQIAQCCAIYEKHSRGSCGQG